MVIELQMQVYSIQDRQTGSEYLAQNICQKIDAAPFKYLPNLQKQLNQANDLKEIVDFMQVKIQDLQNKGPENLEKTKQQQYDMKVSLNSLLNDFAVMKKVYTVQKMD